MRAHRVVVAAMVVLLLAGSGAVADSEYVNLSRYRVSVSSSNLGETVRTVVSATALNDLCKDEDGCAVVLFNDNVGNRLVADTRLIIKPPGEFDLFQIWSSSNGNAAHQDGSGADTALGVSQAAGTCTFSDVEESGTDTAPGFTLAASAIAPVGCTLTLID